MFNVEFNVECLGNLLLKLKFDRFDAYGATREQSFATHTHIRW